MEGIQGIWPGRKLGKLASTFVIGTEMKSLFKCRRLGEVVGVVCFYSQDRRSIPDRSAGDVESASPRGRLG